MHDLHVEVDLGSSRPLIMLKCVSTTDQERFMNKRDTIDCEANISLLIGDERLEVGLCHISWQIHLSEFVSSFTKAATTPQLY